MFYRKLKELDAIEIPKTSEIVPVVPSFDFSSFSARKGKDEEIDNDTDDDESTIFEKNKAIINALKPVQLDDKTNSEFEKVFYNRKRDFLIGFAKEMAAVNANINTLFSFLRYCLVQARHIATLDRPELQKFLNGRADDLFKSTYNDISFDAKKNNMTSVQAVFEEYLENTGSGCHHIIRPSVRYRNGFDVLFIGGHGSKNIEISNSTNQITAFSESGIEDDDFYKKEYLEAYATEFSQKVIAAGEEILNTIFPNQNITDAESGAERKVAMLPIKFNFESVNDIFFKHTGIMISAKFLRNINASSLQDIEKYFSILVVRNPSKQITTLLAKDIKYSEDGKTSLKPSQYLTKEGMALSQSISFAFAINVPQNIAEYVSQAEKGEKISLLSLNNWIGIWSTQYLKKPRTSAQGGRIRIAELPRYVLPVSKSLSITKIRKENNLALEKGRSDENNISISPNGGLVYLPKQESREKITNVKDYEADLEHHLKTCFELGVPSATGTLPDGLYAEKRSNGASTSFNATKFKAFTHAGKLLTYDWDYNIVITVQNANPTAISSVDINGAASPDALTVGDYLGFNFAKEGQQPLVKSFADSIQLMLNIIPDEEKPDSIGDSSEPDKLLTQFEPMIGLLEFYKYMALRNKVPGCAELLARASKEISEDSYKDLEQAKVFEKAINSDRSLNEFFTRDRNDLDHVDHFIKLVLTAALQECSGNRRSLLRYRTSLELENPSPSVLEDEIKDSPYYFDPKNSPASDFGRLYNFIGGAVFRVAMESIASLSMSDLFNSEPEVETKNIKEPNKTYRLNKPNFSRVSSQYMPMAVLFSKYIPNASSYLEAAERQAEENAPNESIDVDDIKVSGCVKGAQLFPHQVIAHKRLRNKPKFAILDIAPGGGKTTLALTDIGAMFHEIAEIGGEHIKPIILCPDNLIKNWIDDITIFTKDKYNMIPINHSTFKRWGPEKLAELINNAPVNTIVVAGFNFMSGNKFKVAIGTSVIRISSNIEFLKSFGFNYIAIDESHRMKNKKTSRHRMCKQLTTSSYVKYVRILSGTIIADKVKDIVGQTALVNSHIFSDKEFENNLNVTEALERRRSLELNGEKIPTWEVDTPQRARQKLAKYASVITMKRKEWAFMMPTPIEKFYAVSLEPGENASAEEIELGNMHQRLYDAVLEESLEALQELQKKAKAKKASSEEADEDDEDEDEDDDELGGDMEIDEGDEFGGISQKELKPYIARLERLVVNPMADPLAPKIFGAAGVKHYVSRKAKFIADLVDKHFNPPKWDKDTHYQENALVNYEGKLWYARKVDVSDFRSKPLPKETVGIPPSSNLDTWKEEPEGKVIIICRYTNSVQGVYDAMPVKYQNLSVKYTGEEKNKESNLDAFVSSNETKILIANELGISEGHNLQIASRIIRCESPWGPGELDQTSSRVFRPDPKAAKAAMTGGKPGELYRDVIFLDWVLADNTMEVAKQARLIGKIFNKARFDEMESTKKFKIQRRGRIEEANYADILDDYHLEPISMGLETLRSRNSLNDDMISEYVAGYSQLNALTRQEFHEMRLTQDHVMKNLPEVPLIPAASKIQTPFVTGQKPPILPNINLLSVKKFVKTEGNEEFRRDPSKLIGSPVVTDMGKGQIVRVTVRYEQKLSDDLSQTGRVKTERVLDADGNPVADAANPISSIVVKIAATGESFRIPDTGLAFIPLNIDNKTMQKEFAVGSYSIGKAAEKEAEKAAIAAAKEKEKEAKQEARRRLREAKEAAERNTAAEDAKKRLKNIKEGKPINMGVVRVKKLPVSKDFLHDEESGKDMTLELHPASFHGFLVLEAEASDPDSVDLKKHKFRMSGPYAYCTTDRLARFNKILDYIEDNFHLSDASVNRLVAIQDAFEESGKKIYRSELAPTSELPYFFATRKQIVKDKKEIRPYPIIMPDELLIAVDLNTCPIIKRHVGKTIPGAATKWEKSEGNALYFARNKEDIKNKAKELMSAGFTISNKEELIKEITNLKFRKK